MANYRGLPSTSCPHCGEVVLRGAARCKNCFESLEVRSPGNVWGFLLLDLVLILVLAVGLHTAYSGYPQMNVITDQESSSIIIVKKFSEDHYEAARVHFDEIVRIESLADQGVFAGSSWVVSVIDSDGRKHEINYSKKGSLESYAQTIAEVTGKPLESINKQTRSVFAREGQN